MRVHSFIIKSRKEKLLRLTIVTVRALCSRSTQQHRVPSCLGFATFSEVLGSCRERQTKVLVSIALGKPRLSCLQQDPATVRFCLLDPRHLARSH